MSCLFHSLSAFIQGTDATSLRHILADYLEKNPVLYDNEKISDIVQWEDGRPTLEQYVAKMRLQSTWGGAIEIKAFCDLFRASVSVLVLRDGKTVEFKPSPSGTSALTGATAPTRASTSEPLQFVISWNGFHYEPVFT
jgi:hypothetical protein